MSEILEITISIPQKFHSFAVSEKIQSGQNVSSIVHLLFIFFHNCCFIALASERNIILVSMVGFY